MCGWKLMISAGCGSGQNRSCFATVLGGMLSIVALCSGFSATSAPVGMVGSLMSILWPARRMTSSTFSRFNAH